ncbi:aspartate aminotransferase family protein [Pseudomonas sp. UBA6310]|uniref:aspartate aminotransferase family protein n=2 Tax=unclassified Pseudomonas TaxID=196821 RepID=UPI00257F355F|nr:aminotransferase class III-fold pyridoxal phosphate-dependent enzyme [Pseudomonas sp. UBA6310]
MRDIQARLRLMHTIERPEQVFVRGQGSWLWDSGGRAYLDFHQGGAANSLGHSPSALVEALQRQAENLLNPGPSFYSRSLLKLAARLCQATGSEQAYFLNSGAEANEAAVQLARKWGRLHRGGARKVISASQSGHGLTFGALSEQGEARNGFGSVPFNDLAALQAAVDDDTVAILLEPVQGDAGVIPATLEYLQGAERLCRERGLLLILDEVQTGIGRCGSLLAEELYGVRADIVTLGKGLGGGVPLAALLARGNAGCFEPGDLGGTLHGNPLMTSAGLAVLQATLEPGFLEHIREVGERMREGLARLSRRSGHGPLRGHGLLIGLPLLGLDAPAVVRAALAEGLLISAPHAHCLRFSPALTVSGANVEEMLKRLAAALARAKTATAEVA